VPSSELDEFAALLIEHVRDAAIRSCDRRLRPDANSVIARRWREVGATGGGGADVLIADCVDDTIFHLLRSIDEGLLPLKFVSKSGRVVDLVEEGSSELAGEYMGGGVWREAHSKERIGDYFSDDS